MTSILRCKRDDSDALLTTTDGDRLLIPGTGDCCTPCCPPSICGYCIPGTEPDEVQVEVSGYVQELINLTTGLPYPCCDSIDGTYILTRVEIEPIPNQFRCRWESAPLSHTGDCAAYYRLQYDVYTSATVVGSVVSQDLSFVNSSGGMVAIWSKYTNPNRDLDCSTLGGSGFVHGGSGVGVRCNDYWSPIRPYPIPRPDVVVTPL